MRTLESFTAAAFGTGKVLPPHLGVRRSRVCLTRHHWARRAKVARNSSKSPPARHYPYVPLSSSRGYGFLLFPSLFLQRNLDVLAPDVLPEPLPVVPDHVQSLLGRADSVPEALVTVYGVSDGPYTHRGERDDLEARLEAGDSFDDAVHAARTQIGRPAHTTLILARVAKLSISAYRTGESLPDRGMGLYEISAGSVLVGLLLVGVISWRSPQRRSCAAGIRPCDGSRANQSVSRRLEGESPITSLEGPDRGFRILSTKD